ncbi:S-ribosylhomocysteine lyase [Sporosarcina sp. Marseille-Q4063]|uniref:S-ribosylhomocysteine lyase n=1 Tax=Sporosarcina sp. Marseille-Q4063 TaxID=2810514 RepID=UPI001BAFCB2E|nr:S-ribosylhomocysteine lyase [Sporosarcina sp. Marseille-Q4063]QUW22840.1 S-ribosylhomocysteine lyase [Sporosarcina sp. Marseille-Q4063]
MEKLNVESFNLDHTKVAAPYVRLAGTKRGALGDEIYKYDLRFTQPNTSFMKMDALHSIEHIMAENIRNHTDQVVDLSPMGCQTGFYLTVINHDNYDDILSILEKTLHDVLAATEVPACNVVQCGWAANHSLEGAKELAKNMLAKKDEWHQVYKEEK